MKEKVCVSIKGSHMILPNEMEEMEEIVNIGRYNVAGKKEYIRYEEMLETKKCSNLIKIDGDVVTVTKKGATTMNMVFKKNERTVTTYSTEYGAMNLGIMTRGLDILRDEDIIKVSLGYSIEVNGEQVSDCMLVIKIVSHDMIKLLD